MIQRIFMARMSESLQLSESRIWVLPIATALAVCGGYAA